VTGTERRPPRLPVIFDQGGWDEDLAALNAPLRRQAEETRRRIEREGGLLLATPDVWPCDPNPRDGTQLAGCVKHYAGDLRLVLELNRRLDGTFALLCLAVGEGHPADLRRLSAYQRAHARRHPAG
jgi:hypothetical protein